jgi:outer membrane lipoprotein-sorting protein
MKKIFTLCLFVLGFNLVYAQKDPVAKEILDKLSEKTKSHETITTDFKVEFKNIKENIQNSSEGSITIKGDMYRLKFMDSESFYDGKTLWSFLPEVNEVNITEPEADDEDIFNNPKRLFTIYENDYKYQLIDNIAENDQNYSLIDLYPIGLEEDFSRIRLQINTDEYFLSSATIFGKDGSHYTIRLNNYKTNSDFEDSYFIFDEQKHPKVEIIDLRF